MAKKFIKQDVQKEPTDRTFYGVANGDEFVLSYNRKAKRFSLHKNKEFFGSGFLNACLYDAKKQNVVWEEPVKIEYVAVKK